jgi:hypothetical protein
MLSSQNTNTNTNTVMKFVAAAYAMVELSLR